MSQTRSFKAYNVSSLIVRGDIPGLTYGTVGNISLTAAIAKPISLVDLDGNYYGPGGEYLQLHDTSLLVNAAVPIKSFLLPAAGNVNLPSIFADVCPILCMQGLVIALSSTAGTYTASTNKVDLFGEFEEFELVFPAGVYETTGDLHTAQSPPQITPWATGNGPKRLQRLIVQEQLGVARYIRVDADDTGTYDTKALITPIGANKTVILDFGTGGLVPEVQASNGTLYKGCLISVCDTVTFPFTVTNSSAIIYAIYREFTDNPYY